MRGSQRSLITDSSYARKSLMCRASLSIAAWSEPLSVVPGGLDGGLPWDMRFLVDLLPAL